jgi:hypothetical protein
MATTLQLPDRKYETMVLAIVTTFFQYSYRTVEACRQVPHQSKVRLE